MWLSCPSELSVTELFTSLNQYLNSVNETCSASKKVTFLKLLSFIKFIISCNHRLWCLNHDTVLKLHIHTVSFVRSVASHPLSTRSFLKKSSSFSRLCNPSKCCFFLCSRRSSKWLKAVTLNERRAWSTGAVFSLSKLRV